MTDLSRLSPDAQGKVRDIFDLGDRLLLVASDRISAFDVVLPDPIPHKGEVLTKLSLFWFDLLGDIVPNHLITEDVNRLPEEFDDHLPYLRGRSMLVRKAEVFPIECIVRGYLSGSGWKDYYRTGMVCGMLAPGRTGRVSAASRSHLHAVDQGRDRRPRHEHRLRPHDRHRRVLGGH